MSKQGTWYLRAVEATGTMPQPADHGHHGLQLEVKLACMVESLLKKVGITCLKPRTRDPWSVASPLGWLTPDSFRSFCGFDRFFVVSGLITDSETIA
jgi:hypothetical protein